MLSCRQSGFPFTRPPLCSLGQGRGESFFSALSKADKAGSRCKSPGVTTYQGYPETQRNVHTIRVYVVYIERQRIKHRHRDVETDMSRFGDREREIKMALQIGMQKKTQEGKGVVTP